MATSSFQEYQGPHCELRWQSLEWHWTDSWVWLGWRASSFLLYYQSLIFWHSWWFYELPQYLYINVSCAFRSKTQFLLLPSRTLTTIGLCSWLSTATISAPTVGWQEASSSCWDRRGHWKSSDLSHPALPRCELCILPFEVIHLCAFHSIFGKDVESWCGTWAFRSPFCGFPSFVWFEHLRWVAFSPDGDRMCMSLVQCLTVLIH